MSEVLSRSIEKLHGVFERTDIEIEWKKVGEKIEEARYNPGALTPLVDCIFSLLLAARSRGYGVDAVMAELDKVAGLNLERRWKKMEDGTYRAV